MNETSRSRRSVRPYKKGRARPASGRKGFLARLSRDKGAVIGFVPIALLTLMSLAPGLFTRTSPTTISVTAMLQAPSRQHPLGTDELGRDVWSRVIHGSRASLFVAATGSLLSLLLGTPFGVLAAYIGGRFDNITMRILDVLMAFPAILLALMLVASLGPGMESVILAVGIVYAPRLARVARGAVLSAKQEMYVEASRATGGSMLRILFRHVLPNTVAPVSVFVTVSIGMIILVEATLSFLGVGLQPPHPSWGYMLATGKDFMELSPWPVVGPGLFIMLAVVGFNLFGDGLQDVTNPRLR